MRVLITGGLGFIGSTTARYLLDRGEEVVVMDNLSRNNVMINRSWIEEADFYVGDVRRPKDYEKAGKVDGILHCAANPGIPESLEKPIWDFRINALGTLNALEYARKNGNVPFVYCSTNKTYSQEKIDGMPITEHNDRYEYTNEIFGVECSTDIGIGARSPYGCSKLAGDIYCQEYDEIYNVPTAINRMSCITKEAMISTLDGKKKLKDMIDDDERPLIYCLDGEKRLRISKIKKIWKTGKKRVTRLVLDDETYLELTDEHRVLTRGGYKKVVDIDVGEYVFRFAFQDEDDLPIDINIEWDFNVIDSHYFGSKSSSSYYREKAKKRLQKILVRKNYKVLARLCGYIFGDGHLGMAFDKQYKKWVTNVSFYDVEEVLKTIKHELNILGFNMCPIERKKCVSKLLSGHVISGYMTRMRSGSSHMLLLFSLLGCHIGNTTKYGGGLPWFVKGNDILEKEFLRGFFDAELADIKYYDKKCCWSGLSLVIAKQKGIENVLMNEICEILDRVGIIYSPVKIKPNVSTDKTNHYVLNIHKSKKNLRMFATIGFSMNTKRQNTLMSAIGTWASVKKKEKVLGTHDVYDIEVENYHNFFASDINVHNCIYGPHQFGLEEQGWIAWFVIAAVTGQPLNIYGNGKQVRDMLYGEDLARLFHMQLTDIDNWRGVFNVGGGPNNTMSLIEAISYIEWISGHKFELRYYPKRPADHDVYISDIRELKKEGWEPRVKPEEGISRIYEWVKENREMWE